MDSLGELVQFAPDTYGVRWQRHLALFIVTSEGVILVDPIGQINPKAPYFVKEAIAQVTPLPVKYVIYSHWGADHGMGGDAFADTATFVGHVNCVERIKATPDPKSPLPTITFNQPMHVDLGGTRVDLYPSNLSKDDEYIVIHHADQRIAMLVDIVQAKSAPYRTLLGEPDKITAHLKWLHDWLDFDTLISGHTGPLYFGTKEDVLEARQYYFDLGDAIEAARKAGHIDQSPEMAAAAFETMRPKYGDWSRFTVEALAENIEGFIRWNAGEQLR
jgi:hypothetical protein